MTVRQQNTQKSKDFVQIHTCLTVFKKLPIPYKRPAVAMNNIQYMETVEHSETELPQLCASFPMINIKEKDFDKALCELCSALKKQAISSGLIDHSV